MLIILHLQTNYNPLVADNIYLQLNYRDSKPIYEQIKEGLRRLVITGAIAKDEKLPSVRELASELAINPNTIQRAYMELEKLGLIYPVKGRGNFVADSSQVQKINRESYRKEFTALIQKGRNTGFNREELEKMLAEIFEKEDES